MIILHTINDGHVTSARSDDGLVTALVCPTTTLYGEFDLVDHDGRHMARGEYLDYSRPLSAGTMTGEKVPAAIWASAVQLMHDWAAHQSAREDAARAASLGRDLERYGSRSEQIAQDMDRADSDL